MLAVIHSEQSFTAAASLIMNDVVDWIAYVSFFSLFSLNSDLVLHSAKWKPAGRPSGFSALHHSFCISFFPFASPNPVCISHPSPPVLTPIDPGGQLVDRNWFFSSFRDFLPGINLGAGNFHQFGKLSNRIPRNPNCNSCICHFAIAPLSFRGIYSGDQISVKNSL